MYIIQTIKGQFECYTGQHCSSESQEWPETLTFFIQVFIPKATQLCTFQNLEQDGTLTLFIYNCNFTELQQKVT